MKDSSKKIKVMVTGTYDLFHAGHVRFLKLARSFGDELYVGVVPDGRVTVKKGALRPIFPMQHRLEILNQSESVTEARPIPSENTVSSRDGIRELIERWKPDIWVDGAHGSAKAHAEYFQDIYGLTYKPVDCELIHTTTIIDKIKAFYDVS